MIEVNKKMLGIELIEKGFSNVEIARALDISRQYAAMIRFDYNKASDFKIFDKHKRRLKGKAKPSTGTLSREVYDMIKSGVICNTAIRLKTGASSSIIKSVKRRYFEPLPPPITHNYLRTIELWELRP